MKPSQKLRAKLKQTNASITALVNAVDAEGKSRALTDAEKASLQQLRTEYVADKDKLAQLEELESDEAAFGVDDQGGGQGGNQGGDQPQASAQLAAPAETRSRMFGPRPRIATERESAPAVHTKKHVHSIARAMQQFFVEKRSRLDGLEGEISRDIALRMNRPPTGFYIPIGTEPEYREHLGFSGLETRDLTTTTGAGTIFTVPQLPFIEYLRNQLVMQRAGATFLSGLNGPIAFPRQTGTATAYRVAEGVPADASNQALDQITMGPKQIIALTNITKLFLAQASLDAEKFVRDDLASVLAQAIDWDALNATGGSSKMTGILQDTSIQSLSSSLAGGSANGDALTWEAVVAMESSINASNANRGRMAVVTTNQVRGKLKVTPKLGTTFPVFLWDDPLAEGYDGLVNGYRAFATGNMPSNNTKGNASNLSSLIFGNFADYVIGQWGGIDILDNPYTLQASGGRTISAMILVDGRAIRPASFRIRTDIVAA